jgi:hypothetical protein
VEQHGGRFNVCFDTHGAWIGVVEDGTLSALEPATGTLRSIGSIQP